jgi:hypothetical protein
LRKAARAYEARKNPKEGVDNMKPTPGEILEAFKNLGLTPIRKGWGDGKDTACGLGAVAVYRKGILPSNREHASHLLEVSEAFVAGFLDVWDSSGNPSRYASDAEYQEGRNVAAQALEALYYAGYDI